MITGKQRAKLRSLANGIDVIVQIGKNGITQQVALQAEQALHARELVKFGVLESALISSREAANVLAERLRAEVVQVIGSKFILYRRNKKKKDGIIL